MALDFTSPAGRRALRLLLERADIVLESARPRALEQLGIRAETWTSAAPGRTWVSITGYGRSGERGQWVAFGDDAAAAAGLARAAAPGADGPVFCADAVADPLAGVHAALAAHTAWRAGGGRLVEIALADVAAHCLATGPDPGPVRVERHGDRSADGAGRWRVRTAGGSQDVLEPRARVPAGAARPLGADTADVLRELGIRC